MGGKMSPFEREIIPQKLSFYIQDEVVNIGVNKIQKQTYLDFKDAFDFIINTGDTAWNNKLSKHEIDNFVKELAFNKVERENKLIPLNRECKNGCENMDMKELAKQETIKNGFDNIPVGMTKLIANTVEITPTEVEFNGVKKTRYELTAKTVDGKDIKYSCGVQIYNGLVEASKVKDIKTVYITRNGTTKDDTKYTVVGE
jgi:hypothetical protein